MLHNDEKKSRRIEFRVSEKEYSRLEKESNIQEKGVNLLCRDIVLRKKFETKNITSIKKNLRDYGYLLTELKKEGVNLNQIAKSINEYQKAEGAVTGIKKLFSKQHTQRFERFVEQLNNLRSTLDATQQALEKSKPTVD